MKNKSKIFILAATVAAAMSAAPAQAQNPGFTYGDLILGIQSTGASTTTSYVLANLGQAGTLRDTTVNLYNIVNIGSALTAEFGITWYNRTDLYFGLATVGSNDEFDPVWGDGAGPVNGDPWNTVYVSAARTSIGTAGSPGSNAWSLGSASQVQDAANGIYPAATAFETLGASGIATISKTASFNDWNDQNSFDSGNNQNAAFGGVFSGGIQFRGAATSFGSIGGVNAEAALDLYRIIGVNNQPGQVGFGGTIGAATFEGTVVVDQSGNASLIVQVPEPSTLSLFGLTAALAGFVRRRRPVTA